MNDDVIKNMCFEDYVNLKKEVSTLYEIMMEMHQARKRDSSYANARFAYMEKRNLMQQVLEHHPEYEENSPQS